MDKKESRQWLANHTTHPLIDRDTLEVIDGKTINPAHLSLCHSLETSKGGVKRTETVLQGKNGGYVLHRKYDPPSKLSFPFGFRRFWALIQGSAGDKTKPISIPLSGIAAFLTIATMLTAFICTLDLVLLLFGFGTFLYVMPGSLIVQALLTHGLYRAVSATAGSYEELEVLSETEAKAWFEDHASLEAYDEQFGLPDEL